jgi:PAS domain S-box-containing protein
MVSALKRLGFKVVEETAIGAQVVADLYKDYLTKGKYENLLTTCCPSANYLIEHYYPSLIKYMIPIVSPMIAHGKLLKEVHGEDSYVVFIGPCIAKKFESLSHQHQGIVDAVLTFEELQKWFNEENLDLFQLTPEEFDKKSYIRGRGFPTGGGVIKSFLNNKRESHYEIIVADGIEACVEAFEGIEKGILKGACIELNICRGSCIGGPAMPQKDKSYYNSKKKVKEYVHINEEQVEESSGLPSNLNFSKKFFHKKIIKKIASEDELVKILKKIGKHEKADELNCGGCGYNTCRDKAQAVFEEMAEEGMCLPFMRSKAEGMTNVIFENSPNIIMVVDDEFRIKELNPAAEAIFQVKANEVKGQPISIITEMHNFYRVKEMKKDLIRQKIIHNDIILEQDLLYLENQNVFLSIMKDISYEEKNKKELIRVKERTINAAQKVIEKQMRVAQEIASLLGETTAETKIILTRLKEIAREEEGDI